MQKRAPAAVSTRRINRQAVPLAATELRPPRTNPPVPLPWPPGPSQAPRATSQPPPEPTNDVRGRGRPSCRRPRNNDAIIPRLLRERSPEHPFGHEFRDAPGSPPPRHWDEVKREARELMDLFDKIEEREAEEREAEELAVVCYLTRVYNRDSEFPSALTVRDPLVSDFLG